MFEKALENSIFGGNQDKSFIDKILAKNDIETIRALIRKDDLNRSDLRDILYLLTGTEAKLVNYSEWDRYVILKFYAWIRDFVKMNELLFDYKEKMDYDNLDNETKELFGNSMRIIEHNLKFLIDLYLNISRTSLSVGATGFMDLLKNKFEVSYGSEKLATNSNQNKGLFNMKGG